MKVLFRLLSILIFLPACFVGLSGCGKGAGGGGLIAVAGKVNYKTKPVTGGKLTLHSKDGIFDVNIGPDGSFSNGDLPKEFIGEIVVTIDTSELKDQPKGDPVKDKNKGEDKGMKLTGGMPDKGLPDMPKGAPSARSVYVELPPKYADPKQSNLKWTITAGKNEKTFDLN